MNIIHVHGLTYLTSRYKIAMFALEVADLVMNSLDMVCDVMLLSTSVVTVGALELPHLTMDSFHMVC
jgi:hypothetical protein